MYIQGSGTHNTGYSLAIAPNGVDNTDSFSDQGNPILVNTTYK